MKIALVGPSIGGAGRVLSNLGEGFRQLGHDTVSFQPDIKPLKISPFAYPKLTASAILDNYVIKKNNWTTLVSFVRDKVTTTRIESWDGIDLVVVRWPNGIVNLQNIPNYVPVIIGLPDQNSFTGICHYSGNCQNFKNSCHDCPAVRKTFKNLPERNLQRKLDVYNKFKKIGFIAPSKWIYNIALQSEIKNFSIRHILNPIDNDFFRTPVTKNFIFNDEPLSIGFIAANVFDPVKGFSDIVHELIHLVNLGIIKITVAGNVTKNHLKKFPQINFLGILNKKELIQFYDDIDILIIPSREEAAGMVLVEAMSRGVVPLVKPVGGLTDILNNENSVTFNWRSSLKDLIFNFQKTDLEAKSLNAISSVQLYESKNSAKEILQFADSL